MATTKTTLYQLVVHETGTYLGPAAERFIARQIQNHLHKEPQELSNQDLAKLIDWVQVAVSLITEDSKLVEEYIASLRALADQQSTTK